MKPSEIKAAIASPIGTPPIRELAKGKKEVVIIFDDMTRITRVAEIVPFVLEELAEAGIPDSRIRFIAAIGCHGAMDRVDFAKKLGEDTLARFPVYNHNPFFNCTYVGTTSYGTKVYVNAEVMKCDLKIAIGSIVPHPMSGFGGGGKIILPGVTSIETTEDNHKNQPYTKMGSIDDNPMRSDIEEAATLSGLDVKIDCMVNPWGETVAIFGGALKPAFEAALREAKSHYITPKTKGEEIIISNTFAKANEGIMIGLDTPLHAITPQDTDIVLIANAPDGQVTHYLVGYFGKTTTGNLKLLIQLPQYIKHVIIYSEYSDVAARAYIEESDKVLYMKNWNDVLQTLQGLHGANAKVAVYPNAEIQYCT